MRTKLTAILLIGAVCVLPTKNVRASALNYDFVQANYRAVDLEDVNSKLTGPELVGSLSLSERFFVNGSFNSVNDTIGDAELSVDVFEFGLGYRQALSKTTDYNLSFHYREARSQLNQAGNTDKATVDGSSIRNTVRHMLTPNIELNGTVDFGTVKGESATVEFGLGAVIEVNNKTAMNLGYYFPEDGDGSSYSVGIRYNF